MKFHNLRKPVVALLCALCMPASAVQAWAPKRAAMMTQWSALVNPQSPLPEYPRPQMVRADWLNLNGIWQYQPGQEGDALPTQTRLESEICVPYPVESALSGVMEHHDRLWYRRSFTVPAAWKGKNVKLNFGAVDYESEVFINGKSVGIHTGGYEGFSYDISSYLKSDGPQELTVRVFDPTDNGGQPRGKQSLNPKGIMYTPTTGIWQTVWLEPVARQSIAELHMVPDIDAGVVKMSVVAPDPGANVMATVRIKDGARVVQTMRIRPNVEVAIPVKNAKLWSPQSPFLYDVDVTLTDAGKAVDRVSSYFGMRKVSMGMAGGFNRLLLNNKFTFGMGVLDQGFWPDGLYTAPTDEALASDIKTMKELGFNLVRKHIKVEPARWYYYCDKLGLMVWQDMPSENSYINVTGDVSKSPPLDKQAFEKQLASVVTSHWNAPSIVMWILFNEGQGYYDPARLFAAAKQLDPSRLVSRNSGGEHGNDLSISDVRDAHAYPAPNAPAYNPTQVSVTGEYGGIGYVLKGHAFAGDDYNYFHYTFTPTPESIQDQYGDHTERLRRFRDERGLSAAIYTQLTDVETEINGLMTYDRVLKVDPDKIRLANAFQYPFPTYERVVSTSAQEPQAYKYTLDKPTDNWFAPSYDDSGWKNGPGGFGTAGTADTGKVGTAWNTKDIWLRRTFTLSNLSAAQRSQLVLTDSHDDDIEVYVNGVLAYKHKGWISDYENVLMTDEALRALVPGGENVLAVHCKQDSGGQYVDVGLSLRIPPKVQ